MERVVEICRNGPYYFMSNFYKCSFEYNGYKFSNSEAAFQGMKCPSQLKHFSMLNPSQAKSEGRCVALRSDWEQVKEDIMKEILYAKFSQNKDLKAKLLATGNSTIVEVTTWHDTHWGICTCDKHNGEGKNRLGHLLVEVREELRNE